MAVSAATVPTDFIESSLPAGMPEFAGITHDINGRMYAWRRTGQVWIFDGDVRSASPMIDISEEVGAWADHGLLGFALDPNFLQNGHVYLFYAVDRHHLLHFGTANYDALANEYNQATIGRITRYTANAWDDFRSVDLSSRKVLLGETPATGLPILWLTHSVGSLVFGTDGSLLASCGDGAYLTDGGSASDSYYAQALEDGIITPKENVGAFRSQLVDSLSGKILRLDPATGDGLPSNPFYDPAAPRAPRSRVWALGLRNPFRFTLREGTGQHDRALGDPGVLFIGDVGYFWWEEISVATGPGQNFGWPIFEGYDLSPSYLAYDPPNQDAPNPLHGTDGCDHRYFSFKELLIEDSLNAPSWPNPCNAAQQIPGSIPRFVHRRPALDWFHDEAGPARTGIYNGTSAGTILIGAPDSPVSGPQFGGNCSVGGVFYHGSDFPEPYHDAYFFGDCDGQWLRYAVFDQNHELVSVQNFADGLGAVVGLASPSQRPGLYYATFYEWSLRKILYAPGGNRLPQAVIQADRNYGIGPLAVQFDGTGSSDPEGTSLSYLWNFGDGSPASTDPAPFHLFDASPGVPTRYDVTLTVTDDGGATQTATQIVSVNNTPPQVTILNPADGTLYPTNQQTSFTLQADVADSEHELSELSPRWQVTLYHNHHYHPEPADTNWSPTAVIAPLGCGEETYWYGISLVVTDTAGLSGTNTVLLYPNCNDITSTPPSISVIPDQVTDEDTPTPPIAFTVSDAETAAADLTLAGLSSDPLLVPPQNLAFSGQGSDRLLVVTPAPDQFGTVSLGVQASDGTSTTTREFLLTVQPVNDPPRAVPDELGHFPGQTVKVHTLDLLQNDTDLDSPRLRIAAVNPVTQQGGMVLLNEGWVLYLPPASQPALDSLTYTVTDDDGGEATGTVTVRTEPNLAGSANLLVRDEGDGSFRLMFRGIPGQLYQVQFTETPENPVWETIATVTTDASGAAEFLDRPPAGAALREYRTFIPLD